MAVGAFCVFAADIVHPFDSAPLYGDPPPSTWNPLQDLRTNILRIDAIYTVLPRLNLGSGGGQRITRVRGENGTNVWCDGRKSRSRPWR